MELVCLKVEYHKSKRPKESFFKIKKFKNGLLFCHNLSLVCLVQRRKWPFLFFLLAGTFFLYLLLLVSITVLSASGWWDKRITTLTTLLFVCVFSCWNKDTYNDTTQYPYHTTKANDKPNNNEEQLQKKNLIFWCCGKNYKLRFDLIWPHTKSTFLSFPSEPARTSKIPPTQTIRTCLSFVQSTPRKQRPMTNHIPPSTYKAYVHNTLSVSKGMSHIYESYLETWPADFQFWDRMPPITFFRYKFVESPFRWKECVCAARPHNCISFICLLHRSTEGTYSTVEQFCVPNGLKNELVRCSTKFSKNN